MDINELVRLLLKWSRPDAAKFNLEHTKLEVQGAKEN